jgi:hypothetical protein
MLLQRQKWIPAFAGMTADEFLAWAEGREGR